MKLSLISMLETKKFDILWLEVNTPVGNFVIQSGHAPMILTLSRGRPLIYCLQDGSQQQQELEHDGIIHITRDSAQVFLMQDA